MEFLSLVENQTLGVMVGLFAEAVGFIALCARTFVIVDQYLSQKKTETKLMKDELVGPYTSKKIRKSAKYYIKPKNICVRSFL